jgi:hypothetical protein
LNERRKQFTLSEAFKPIDKYFKLFIIEQIIIIIFGISVSLALFLLFFNTKKYGILYISFVSLTFPLIFLTIPEMSLTYNWVKNKNKVIMKFTLILTGILFLYVGLDFYGKDFFEIGFTSGALIR